MLRREIVFLKRGGLDAGSDQDVVVLVGDTITAMFVVELTCCILRIRPIYFGCSSSRTEGGTKN